MLKKWTVPKIYMAILPALPILSQYSLFGGVLDMDVVAMLAVLAGFLLYRNVLRVKNAVLVLTMLVFTVFVAFVNIAWGKLFATPIEIITRMGRYVIYLTMALVLALDTVEYKTLMKACRVVAYVSFCYIVIQALAFYGAGIVLPCRIGAPIQTKAADIGRLSSLFSEPADMCYSLMPFVTCSLFGPQYREKDTRLRDAVCITIAILLTTSSQGSVCVLVSWAAWIAFAIVREKMNIRYIIAILMAMVVVWVLYNSGVLEYSLGRLEGGEQSTAWQARSGGYDALRLLSPAQRIFGAGYGNYFSDNIYELDTYGQMVNFSSISESLFTQGIIGTLLMVILLVIAFCQGKSHQRILVLVMLGLAIGGSPFTGKFLPLYFSLIMCNYSEKKSNKPVQQETKRI